MFLNARALSGWLFAISIGSFSYCSALEISENPSTIISGKRSCLTRPEGIAFSPTGDCLAIADSDSNSIFIYKYNGNLEILYESIPSTIIRDNILLRYVHDLEFSACGRFLTAAAREANSIVVYKRSELDSLTFEEKPFWFMRGNAFNLNNPASLALSPNGKMLAVCNRMGGSGITFYNQFESLLGKYDPISFQAITENMLLEYDISAPHGAAFSPDGKLIAVVHKTYFKDSRRLGKSALAIYELEDGSPPRCNPTPVFLHLLENQCLHSIAFHPSGKYLATVSEDGRIMIYVKEGDTNAFVVLKTLNLMGNDNKNASPKGIDFSSDGNSLGITFGTPAVYIYDIISY